MSQVQTTIPNAAENDYIPIESFKYAIENDWQCSELFKAILAQHTDRDSDNDSISVSMHRETETVEIRS